MCDLNDLTCFTNTDSIEQLQQNRDNELLKIHKLQLILSIIQKTPIQKIQHPEKENIQKSIKIISVQNYLKLDDNLSVLGLDNCKTIEISYTERKAILNLIKDEIPKKCLPIINYVKDIQKKWPDILKKEQKRTEILTLEGKRQNLHLLLTEIKNKKCGLLKVCAELKMGSYLRNELNLRYSNYKLNQIKANALKSFLIHEFCSSTDHTMKAVKEITKYIEEELEENN